MSPQGLFKLEMQQLRTRFIQGYVCPLAALVVRNSVIENLITTSLKYSSKHTI